jgi:signal transduction histidine kinase/CHASE1-domain containing sensor protein
MPFLPALIAAIIGLGLSVFATKVVQENETSRIRLEFERRVENHLRALEHGMVERVRLIEELRGLFGNSGQGSREDFHVFLSRVDFAWSNAKALAWVPISSGWDKRDMPTYFCEPEPDCRDFLSGYVFAEENWRRGSRSGREGGKTVAFALFEGMPKRETGLGIVTPIFQTGEFEASVSGTGKLPLIGYVIGIFSFGAMVEDILNSQTAPSGLDVYFYRGAEAKPEELVHLHGSRSASLSQGARNEHEVLVSGNFIREFKIADQMWTVVFRPVPEALRQLKSNEAIAALVLGILVTAPFSVYLVLSVRRTSKIEKIVTARTAELHDTNIALKTQSSMVQFLCSVAVRANEASGIEEALEIGLKEVCRFIGWPAGHAYLVTDDGSELLRSTGIWWMREGVEIRQLRTATSMAEVRRGESLPGKVWASKQPIWSEECGTEDNDARSRAAKADGIQTSFALPIWGGPDVAAVLEFFSFESISRDPSLVQALDFIGVQLGRVVERNMAEEELRAARDQAEQANVGKSKFLAAASHDLRQPLQAMNMFVNVLSAHKWDQDSRDVIGHLKDSVVSLEGLLSALLNISKLEAGLVLPKKCDFLLREMFQRLEIEFRPLFESAGLRINVVTPSLAIHSDPVLLESILRNLLANALHYTETGHVLLGARRRAASLQVGVWDSGIGIPEDQQEAIFQEFYQIGRGSGEEGEGVGLGLAIVTRLGKLLGHEIKVRSKLGKGSAFTLEVPFSETPLSLSSPSAEKTESPSAFSMSGKTVMVIDDEERVRIAMRYQLESWGSVVVTAASIGEALDEVSKHVPDLILADYRLSKRETGRKAIRALRKKTKIEIPGILFTGDTEPKRLQKAEKSDLRLLHKPVTPETLRTAIQVELG